MIDRSAPNHRLVRPAASLGWTTIAAAAQPRRSANIWEVEEDVGALNGIIGISATLAGSH